MIPQPPTSHHRSATSPTAIIAAVVTRPRRSRWYVGLRRIRLAAQAALRPASAEAGFQKGALLRLGGRRKAGLHIGSRASFRASLTQSGSPAVSRRPAHPSRPPFIKRTGSREQVEPGRRSSSVARFDALPPGAATDAAVPPLPLVAVPRRTLTAVPGQVVRP